MSRKRTWGAVLSAASLWAVPAWPLDELPRAFANCAGQYSAAMEHAWLMSDPRSDDLARRRAVFISLLEAVGGGLDPAVLNLVIEAKAAQAQLLREASFGADVGRAAWASRRAEALLAACSLLLLDS